MSDHYCVIGDVNALVTQAVFGTTSRPTQAQVEAFIESVALRIDATIANVGYTVPVVSGTLALALLREACAWGAAGLAQQARETAVKTAVDDRPNVGKNVWLRQFDDWLKRLVDPQDPFELPDAPRTSSQLVKQPQNALRSFVQDDEDLFAGDGVVVTRYQVL